MKAWLAALAACSRNAGGAWAIACCAAPEDTASENEAGACGTSSVSLSLISVWNIAPSVATPVAIPTWRKVLLIPDAIPARAALTTPIATEAIPGLVSPIPAPGEEEPGQQRRPAVADLDPVHEQQPERHQHQAGAHQRPRGDEVEQPAGDRGDEEREQGHRQEAQPRLERRVAEHVLDVEREVQEHREHPGREREGDDRDAGERRHPEQRQVEHRVLAA